MTRRVRTYQGHAEVMTGDRCVVIIELIQGRRESALIMSSDQARDLSSILARMADQAEENVETRGTCPTCGRVMHVRVDGTLRLHRDTQGHQCAGSNTSPTSDTSTPDHVTPQ